MISTHGASFLPVSATDVSFSASPQTSRVGFHLRFAIDDITALLLASAVKARQRVRVG
jgi:hypothetical protein